MTEEEMNILISEFLQPQINRFAALLDEAGVEHRLTLSEGSTMGVAFRPEWARTEVFATFFRAVDPEGEVHPILFLSYDRDGDRVHWSVFAEEIDSAKKIDTLVRLLFSGIVSEPYPDATLSEDTPEDEDERILTNIACLPRLNTLSSYLEEEHATQSGVIAVRNPFIQIIEDDFFITLSYQQTEDDNVFLFWIRVDIPVGEALTEEDISTLGEMFNRGNPFAQVYKDVKPVEVYGVGEAEGRTICLASCVPEFGGMPDVDHYILALSLFIESAESLLNG